VTMNFEKNLRELDEQLNQVCISLNLNKEDVDKIKIEISRRNVANSLKGMPLNLLLSMYRKYIEKIRDYGKLE
jgi:hypothetical protein